MSAQEAPDGSGLLVVGAVLLAMLAVVLAVVFLAARFVVRRVRGRGE